MSTITSNARYRQLVNTKMLMNALAILLCTFGNLRPLSLTTLACVNLQRHLALLRKRAIANLWKNTLSILRGTFGNFRPLSLTTSACVNLHTSNARYRQLVNTIMLMNTLAILRGSFGNFRPLSLTTSACVNLHYKLTTDYFERALSATCEHYNVNEHPHNPSGYFR